MRMIRFLTAFAFLVSALGHSAFAEEAVGKAADVAESQQLVNAYYAETAVSQEMELELQRVYPHLDPKGLVPRALLTKALAYYHSHLKSIGNRHQIGVVDFSRHSSKKRFFLIDMSSGVVTALHVAHGKGSDPNADGLATRFSNKVDSDMSSLGFYLTAETYNGDHGLSLRLDGLSSTNSKARDRAVVVHGAEYVHEANVPAGRSWGCLAVAKDQRNHVVHALKGGSLIFAGLE